jgi:hypothetical protein
MTIGKKITMRIQIDNVRKDENNHRKMTNGREFEVRRDFIYPLFPSSMS